MFNLFGDENSKFLKRAEKLVGEINALEPDFEKLSNEELKAKTGELKRHLEKGTVLDDLLPKAFALVREAAKRTLNQRHYDVQLVGGIALHQGKIAEMRTGEGKTLAATAPVYLNALEAKGVHVVTVNDYLARRDAVWMGQIYDALGLSISCLNHETAYLYDSAHSADKLDETRDTLGGFKVVHEFLRPSTRTEAYAADITYGTNNEFGFDYLRDNLAMNAGGVVQRGWSYAIIDEVDSILIDEARTPLIISSPDEESGKLYQQFARIATGLKEGEDYTRDEKLRATSLTEAGINKVEKILGLKNLYEEGGIRLVHHLEQALKAEALFQRDRDYVVKNGGVIIVDQFTGRLMPGRRYSEGLHQAIEAKEGVVIQRESRTVATITFQNYFRKYEKLAVRTGTAKTSEEEFFKVYGLEVVVVPTARPMVRRDLADRIYRTEQGKFKAVARKIKELHEKGQSVLVGTVSIEKNEMLAKLLSHIGIPHKVLNAKNHEEEAKVIAQAGRVGAVTVATNLAGRGVDIILGGNPPEEETAKKVREAGGLFVLGTERHEARRIDNQLRGRAGRQGDSGETQFFVSLEDDLMRIFGGDKVKQIMARLNIPEDEPIESGLVSKAIESAQGRIEGHYFDVRKHVLDYDEVINRQRETIYAMRRTFIQSEAKEAAREKILEFLDNEVLTTVASHTSETGEIDKDAIMESMRRILPIDVKNVEENYLIQRIHDTYKEKEKELGSEVMTGLEKTILLRVIDELWMDHLDEMNHLRSAIGLRAYGQRDPLVEYKNESHRLFKELLEVIQRRVAELIFKVTVIRQPRPLTALELSGPPNIVARQRTAAGARKIGRNEIIKITDGKETKELKYKKALPLLESGQWRLVG